MPIVVPTTLTRPEHVIEFLYQYIEKSNLGFKSILRYDELLVTEYPAVQIMSAGHEKEIHGLHTWLLTLRADIYIMHAKLTEDRKTRTYEDLVLATQLVEYLEQGDPPLKLGGVVIAGWVENEIPGAMPPRAAKMPAVVSTRLHWRGTNKARF